MSSGPSPRGEVSALFGYYVAASQTARFPEALVNITRAQRLDPASASILADKGILFEAGQRDAGIALLKQASAADPAFQSPPGAWRSSWSNPG